MQRRTGIIIASVIAVLLVLCMAVSAIGYASYRFVRDQVVDRAAQLDPSRNDPGADATPRPTARARRTPTPADQSDPTATPRPADAESAAEPTSSSAPDTEANPVNPPANTNPLPEGDVAAALVSGSQSALAQRANATLYRISATLDPGSNQIAGTQTVRYTNTENTPLNEIYFRLYVNAPHYNEGEIDVGDVQVNGTPVEAQLEVDDTALKLPLAQPLAPGAVAEISMNWTATVPEASGGYGLFNESNGVFTLYNWHPELAVYEKDRWLLDPVLDQGDPTNTDASNYVVTFAAPEGYTIVTGGADVTTTSENGNTVLTSVGALMRNFVVVTSDQFESETQQVGETKVTSYYLPGSANGGKVTLDTSVKSLDIYGKNIGAYPYKELDVAQVDLGGGAAGMESTGLIMIGSEYYDPSNADPLAGLGGLLGAGGTGGNALIFTTAHEVAHQWWYGVVGSDAFKQPWLDESLTNWTSAYYVDETEGAEAGKLARDLFIEFPYRSALSNGDQRLDQPVDQFDSEGYGAIVYGKGPVMYDVLRKELGDEKFFAFLQRWYQEQAFDRGDSEEWLQTLNAVAGKNMQPFYDKWVTGEVAESDLPPPGPLSDMLNGGGLGNPPEDSDPAP